MSDRARTQGEFIRRRLEEIDTTQGELARMVGISTGQVSAYVNDVRPISKRDMPRMATALRTSQAHLRKLWKPPAADPTIVRDVHTIEEALADLRRRLGIDED